MTEQIATPAEISVAVITMSDYQSVSQMRGAVSRDSAADPAAYERANYIGNITSYTSRFLAAQPIRLPPR